MAISIAAHGLLLLPEQPLPMASPSSEHAFRVSLLQSPSESSASPGRNSAQPSTPPQPAQASVSERQAQSALQRKAKRESGPQPKGAAQAQDQVKINGKPEAGAPARPATHPEEHVRSMSVATNRARAAADSRAARAARKSRVRSYLEHYKYYPASARRRGIEGEVELGFSLNAEGKAHAISIVTGSGYAILDEAA